MRRIPIPLLVAALVTATAVVVTLNLTVAPVPLYVDSNFTGPIPAGSAAYWKGAFTEAQFASNATVSYRYFYGAAIAVYAPSIPNATIVRDSSFDSMGDFIQFINLTSGVYLVTYYPGGYYLAVKLVPTKVKGFYIGQALTTSEIDAVSKVNPSARYTLTGSGYDATSDRFFVTILSRDGYTNSIYIPAANQGTGRTFAVKGYDVVINIDGKPIVVRYAAGVALIPSSNTQVTIYVK